MERTNCTGSALHIAVHNLRRYCGNGSGHDIRRYGDNASGRDIRILISYTAFFPRDLDHIIACWVGGQVLEFQVHRNSHPPCNAMAWTRMTRGNFGPW